MQQIDYHINHVDGTQAYIHQSSGTLYNCCRMRCFMCFNSQIHCKLCRNTEWKCRRYVPFFWYITLYIPRRHIGLGSPYYIFIWKVIQVRTPAHPHASNPSHLKWQMFTSNSYRSIITERCQAIKRIYCTSCGEMLLIREINERHHTETLRILVK